VAGAAGGGVSTLGRACALFPALHLAAIAAALLALLRDPSPATLGLLLAAVYLLPVAAYRLLGWRHPLREGVSCLDEPRFSPWWGGHQVQALFIAAPPLEGVLTLVPGLFSLWLRLWGSRVGRGVYWTPRVEIADRGLLDIGDGAIVGHKVEMYAHVVRRRRGRLVLHVRRIVIGRGAFLGAGTRLGPGVRIADGARVPVLTDLYPGARVGRPSRTPAPARPRTAVRAVPHAGAAS
jgi:hypothetical protein